MELSPVVGEPALLVYGGIKVMAVADLHLGIEHELWQCGASIPSQSGKLLARLVELIKQNDPDRLVILGDLKHNVPRTSWQEMSEVPEFLSILADLVKIDIVPGNHDGGLADLVPEGIELHSAGGLVLDGVGYFHGHTWPRPRIFEAGRIVAAHLHPSIRLVDPLGSSTSEQVWAAVPLSPKALSEHYGMPLPAPDMLIVPAYNPLSGGYPLNAASGDDRGPIPKISLLNRARIYLLDGTDLGRLDDIRSVQR